MLIVENRKPRLTHITAKLALKPGVNVLNEEDEEALVAYAETKVGRAKFESKALVVIEEPENEPLSQAKEPTKPTGEGAGEQEPQRPLLARYNADKAIELIKATLDPAKLEQWAAEETRKTVLAALTEQFDKLQLTDADREANKSKPTGEGAGA